MRRFVLLLLGACAWPRWPAIVCRSLPPARRAAMRRAPLGLSAARHRWGEIRARYRLKHLWVPA